VTARARRSDPAILAIVGALTACRTPPPQEADAQASPQALAMPAALASAAAPEPSAPLLADAGRPPTSLARDKPLPADALGKDFVGWSIEMTWRPADPPVGPRAPEVSTAAVDAVRKKTEPRVVVDLGAGRMRMQLASAGFVLPRGTELRARSDRYGFLLVSEDGRDYRVLPAGTLRAALGERRLDVAPSSGAETTALGDGPRRLGFKTRRVQVATRAGKVVLELARLPDAEDSGALLARAIVALVGAPPQSAPAQADEVPLGAEISWATRGGLTLEAMNATRRTDLAAQLAVPPQGAALETAPLPARSGAVLVDETELRALHTGPGEIGPQTGSAGAQGSLALVNGTDELRFVWLDGAPVAWLAPHARLSLDGLHRGRYQIAWRTFLGDGSEPPRTVVVPGTAEIGTGDAGAP
jgi:hypothetical protein